MSAVTILTSALQGDSGTGDAVDVSAYNTLRLSWSALFDTYGLRDPNCYLRLVIETAQVAGGPWREIYRRQLDSSNYETTPRVVLSGFDSFVRARWEGQFPRSGEQQRTAPVTKVFTIGLAGEGI